MISFVKKLIPVALISFCFFGGAKISYATESLVLFSTHYDAVVAASTYYLIPANGDNGLNTTEDQAYFIAPTNGILQNLYITSGDPGGANTITATMRIDGADTSLFARLTSGLTTKLNSTTTVAVTAGQRISLKVATSAALGGGYYIVKASVTFKPTNSKYAAVFGTTEDATTVNTGTYYYGLMGELHSATQSTARNLMPTSGKFGNFYFYRGTAPGAGTSETRTLQYNGTNSSITATISNTENVASDTTHTQYVSAGDLVGFVASHSGTPALTRSIWSATFESDFEGESLMMLSESTPTNDVAYWGFPQGSLAYWSNLEPWSITQYSPINYRVKKIYVDLGTAPGASKSWKFGVDNAYQTASGVECTVSDSATACSDTTNSAQITALQEFSIRATPTSAPAASTVKVSYVLFSPSAPLLIPRQPNNLGLTSYWSFNDGSGTVATDYSGNGKTGTLVGNTAWFNGKRGRALDFDGSGDYITVDTPALPTGDFTYAAWINYDSVSNTPAIFMAADGAGGNEFRLELSTSAKLNVVVNNTSSGAGNTTIPAGQWVHVVATRSGGTITRYINGMSEGEGTDNSTVLDFSTCALLIGNDADSLCTGTLGNDFNGRIDEARIYNRALSASEVDILYRSTFGKENFSVNDRLTSGLVGAWTFNDPDITTDDITDVTGNGNRGGFIGGATSTAKTIGKIGQALSFDGVDDYINAGTGSSLNLTSAISISAWIKPLSFGEASRGRIIDKNADASTGYLFMTDNFNVSNGISFQVNASGGGNALQVPNVITLGIWQHVLVTFNGSTARMYVNGVSVGSGSVSTILSSSNAFIIGNTVATDRSFNGSIDEVRVYNRVLSASEIKELSLLGTATVDTSQNSRIPSGLVGFWSLNGPDITANDIVDVTGNGNRGGLINGATSSATVIGKVGQGFYLNDGPYIKVADSTSLDFADSFSYALWLKRARTASTAYEIIISKGENSAVLGITGTNDSAEVRDRLFFCKHTGACIATSTIKILDSEWHHVTLTKSGATTKMYIDGVDRTGVVTNATIENTALPLHIGTESHVPGTPLKGSIDEIRVYNRAITPAEVFQLYRAGR